jgi:hypothetical protein
LLKNQKHFRFEADTEILIFEKNCIGTKFTFADLSNLSKSFPRYSEIVPIGKTYQSEVFPQNTRAMFWFDSNRLKKQKHFMFEAETRNSYFLEILHSLICQIPPNPFHSRQK